MRTKWVDVNLDMYDFLEARVEAMAAHIKNLEAEIEAKNETIERLRSEQTTGYGSLPCLLV